VTPLRMMPIFMVGSGAERPVKGEK